MVHSKLEACGQTVLPDRSILIGQKMVENAKIETFWVVFKRRDKEIYFQFSFLL